MIFSDSKFTEIGYLKLEMIKNVSGEMEIKSNKLRTYQIHGKLTEIHPCTKQGNKMRYENLNGIIIVYSRQKKIRRYWRADQNSCKKPHLGRFEKRTIHTGINNKQSRNNLYLPIHVCTNSL